MNDLLPIFDPEQDNACRRLGGVHPNTIFRLIAKGHLQKVKVGARTMIDQRDLEAYVEAQRKLPPKTTERSNVVPLRRGGSFREQARAINEARR